MIISNSINQMFEEMKTWRQELHSIPEIGLEEYQIYIYDTWGNLLWESDKLFKSEPLEGWDGKDLEGNDMPQDTYVWKISAKFLNGRIWLGKTFPDGSVKRFGTVTLIR